MARVRARSIYRPQIIAARKEWVGWFLIVMLLLTPWLLSAASPWLVQQFMAMPSRYEAQVLALRHERKRLRRLQQRSQALEVRIAQLEFDLLIDRQANRLAAKQIQALKLERAHLQQSAVDLRQLLGANAPAFVAPGCLGDLDDGHCKVSLMQDFNELPAERSEH
ncbi:hypothetical protein [Rhabdochromatium marinum]|uniref:hypothetical protein n=1 Tax=Rhabdochromatium marinum TaxID=48729 RepID=UPI0019048A46|nr:hypothetical protein [Rhabdochromatium marinum]MBK1648625.1 hypothetical protein [Rhabdochromatium marinum]